jgi:AAA15 family ATPase/GTPase
MKLRQLKISNYKLFENLVIDFNETASITTIIGRNGSGKTTLMECIIMIFSNLFKCNSLDDFSKIFFPFKFNVNYMLRHETKVETNIWGNSFVNYIGIELNYEVTLSIKVYDGLKTYTNWSEIAKYLSEKGEKVSYLLPANLAVYYSGISDLLFQQYKEFQINEIKLSLDGDVQIDQSFYYFIPKDFEAIMVALLSYQYGNIPDKLKSKYGITQLISIDITFKKPIWAKHKTSVSSYWGATGNLSVFFTIAKSAANAVSIDGDKLKLTFTDTNHLETLWSYYGSEKRLFEYLVTLQANDLIESISIKVKKNELEIDVQNLSEGEKQMLIITGLKELLSTENSLFLLDEPDTYLHPEWKRAFVPEFFNDDDTSQNYTIITSHSPDIISAMKKGQLKILQNIDGKAKLKTISINPYGKPVDQVLIEFFGVDGLRYKEVQLKLDALWDLVKVNKFDEPVFKIKFADLEKEIGKDDKDLTALKLEIIRRSKKS